MQTNLLWEGREYYSLEKCLVNTVSTGTEITSAIVGKYGAKIYRVEYKIRTNQNWETQFCEIKSQHSNQREHLTFEIDGKGNWMVNGESDERFKDCSDIDIPLTPFTNTLPIRRLNFDMNEQHEINVIYIDLLERQITRVKQKYIRLSNTEYHYENIPNDFEARIKVDAFGFVVDYPSLFIRKAELNTDYPSSTVESEYGSRSTKG